MAKCGDVGQYGPCEGKVCARPIGHLGLHRDTPRVKPITTVQWGDNDGRPA